VRARLLFGRPVGNLEFVVCFLKCHGSAAPARSEGVSLPWRCNNRATPRIWGGVKNTLFARYLASFRCLGHAPGLPPDPLHRQISPI
jgi:hypothetical protein